MTAVITLFFLFGSGFFFAIEYLRGALAFGLIDIMRRIIVIFCVVTIGIIFFMFFAGRRVLKAACVFDVVVICVGISRLGA